MMLTITAEDGKTVSGDYEGPELWTRIMAAHDMGRAWTLEGTGYELRAAARS